MCFIDILPPQKMQWAFSANIGECYQQMLFGFKMISPDINSLKWYPFIQMII